MPDDGEPLLTLNSIMARDGGLADFVWLDLIDVALETLSANGGRRLAAVRRRAHGLINVVKANRDDAFADRKSRELDAGTLLALEYQLEFGSEVISPNFFVGCDLRSGVKKFIRSQYNDTSTRMEHIANNAGRGGPTEISIDDKPNETSEQKAARQKLEHKVSEIVREQTELSPFEQARAEQIARLKNYFAKAMQRDERYETRLTIARVLAEIFYDIPCGIDLGVIPEGLVKKNGTPNWVAIEAWLNKLGIETSDKPVKKAAALLVKVATSGD
ncbi:MAG: hypothetical protein KGZ73_09245 [Rhizobiales bacterium]|nr:hypothetical protein [Hyphomicrobiales bacterium]